MQQKAAQFQVHAHYQSAEPVSRLKQGRKDPQWQWSSSQYPAYSTSCVMVALWRAGSTFSPPCQKNKTKTDFIQALRQIFMAYQPRGQKRIYYLHNESLWRTPKHPRMAWETMEEKLGLAFNMERRQGWGESSQPNVVLGLCELDLLPACRLSYWLAHMWGKLVKRRGRA